MTSGSHMTAEEQAAYEIQRHRAWVFRSQLPANLVRTFDELDDHEWQREAMAKAKAWGRGEFPGLLLSGKVGTGKSQIAAAALIERCRMEQVQYVSASELGFLARSGYETEARDRANEVLLGDGALFLDDIDKGKQNDYGTELIFQLVDRRTSRNSPLIVTTNVSAKKMAELVGEAVVSRIIGHCELVKVPGEVDLRWK